MATKRKRKGAKAASETPKEPVAVVATPVEKTANASVVAAKKHKKRSKKHKAVDADAALQRKAPEVAATAASTEKKPLVESPTALDAGENAAAKKKKKKKSKAKSVAATATAAAAPATPPSKNEAKTKKAGGGNEIDDLFASLKSTKQKQSLAEEQQKRAEEEAAEREQAEKQRLQKQIKKLEAQNTNSTAAGVNPDPRPVRYDEDGLPIYSEASLQLGKGGDTSDCPFDCWCCF